MPTEIKGQLLQEYSHNPDLAQVTRITVSLTPQDCIGYSLPRLGDVVALPNTQKQTQGGQNEETKKHISNENTE